MNPRIAKRARVLALTALSMGLSVGCAPGGAREPVEAIIAFDVSCPVEARLLAYAKTAYSAQRALPPGSRLRVYVFGQGSFLVYDGPKIAGRDTFNRKVGEVLLKPPTELSLPGTRTDRLFEKMAADVKNSDQPCLVLVATDGGMEDQGEEAIGRLGASVKRLCASSHLQAVVLAGVHPEYRAQWEDWLRPLGSRALVRGDRDAEELSRLLSARGGAK
jgi:hypothetical protein